MATPAEHENAPSAVRMSMATAVVIVTLLVVWKVIDYRSQPPPPPEPTGFRLQP